MVAALIAGACAEATQMELPEPFVSDTYAPNLKEEARLAHIAGKVELHRNPLDEVQATPGEAASQAVALVRAAEVTPRSGQALSLIMTWYEVEILRVIRPPSVFTRESTCRATTTPAGIRSNGSHRAVMLPGGTIVIDGVRFSDRPYNERRHLQPGRTYLVFGQLCDQTFVPESFSRESVFEVGADGHLETLLDGRTALTETVTRLRTVEAVEEWLVSPRPVLP
jgi:hypothetical protein